MNIILVEGLTDKIIVEAFLKKFGFQNDFTVQSSRGKSHLRNYLLHSINYNSDICAILLDSDQLGLQDARNEKLSEIKEAISNRIKIFIVVPEIESWLLADKKLLVERSKSEDTKLAIERIINPEEASYPRMIISNVFGNLKEAKRQYPSLIEDMDIRLALSSSYTLRDFYNGLLDILEISRPPAKKIFEHPNYTEIQANTYKTLLLDSSNLNGIAFKTPEGEIFTYRDLLREIGSNSDVGKEYVFNLLRSARNILAYQANKGSKKREDA